MILLINIVIGLALAFGTSQLKQLREIVQGEIFCGAFYLLEIIECIVKRSVRIYSSKAIISIIVMIVIPIFILFLFTIIKGFIEAKKQNDSNQEEK